MNKAKRLLAEEYLTVITKYDNEVGTRLTTIRKKGGTHSKVDKVLIDIIKAIDVIEACDEDIQIIAKDVSKIPEFMSELAQFKSILDRLDMAEKNIEKNEKDISELKVDNENLSKENEKLRSEVIKLTSRISGSTDASGRGEPPPSLPNASTSLSPPTDADQPPPLPPNPGPSHTLVPTAVTTTPSSLPPPTADVDSSQNPRGKRLSTKQKTEVRQLIIN